MHSYNFSVSLPPSVIPIRFCFHWRLSRIKILQRCCTQARKILSLQHWIGPVFRDVGEVHFLLSRGLLFPWNLNRCKRTPLPTSESTNPAEYSLFITTKYKHRQHSSSSPSASTHSCQMKCTQTRFITFEIFSIFLIICVVLMPFTLRKTHQPLPSTFQIDLWSSLCSYEVRADSDQTTSCDLYGEVGSSPRNAQKTHYNVFRIK